MLSKWELEDELHAIEEMLADSRRASVTSKRLAYEKSADALDVKLKKNLLSKSLS
jgi:hypothetical protein